MKVLWFSPTPSMYSSNGLPHNGGGWVASLERIVRTDKDIDLAVAFEAAEADVCHTVDGVAYFTINNHRNIWQSSTKAEIRKLQRCLQIIDVFHPDIIQIFGSESYYGKICCKTEIPVVIHMQGSLPPYLNSLYPQAMNKYDFLFTKGLSLRYRFMGWRSENSFKRRAQCEIETIKHCKYFMGRTDWDENIVQLYNSEAKYFHVEEALREPFYNANPNINPNRGVYKIISVISNPWYKGFDVILKTAKLLKEEIHLDFEWVVYGFHNSQFFEQKYGIKCQDINVKIMGTATQEQLVEAMSSAFCYVHPSYIDNSPNSICEAQILGLPVLATNVGGISSLVKDGENGILFAANDPFTLAMKIKMLQNEELYTRIRRQARQDALKRHNLKSILSDLKESYITILSLK